MPAVSRPKTSWSKMKSAKNRRCRVERDSHDWRRRKRLAEKIKQFTWWRKLTADGTHFNTLTRFHEPAEVRGEGILFLEHEGDDNDVQLYLPAYKKIRRVESQSQSGSFMGSEFSYADIATPHVDDYKYELQKEDAPCVIDGGKQATCYVVQSTPATDPVKSARVTPRRFNGFAKDIPWPFRASSTTATSALEEAQSLGHP